MAQVLGSLDSARDAAARHAWRSAYDAYAGIDREELTPADLEHFADAAWWTGLLDEGIRLRERAYTAYSASGDKLGSARLALTLSWDHSGRGAFAVSNGWFATAERLLANEPESNEHAFLTLTRAINALYADGPTEEALSEFDRAFELGTRFGDRDTQVMALVGKGRAFVHSGRIDDGIALLDEATAAAV